MKFAEVRRLQKLFESNLVGTDGSLEDKNTPEYALKRGVIGEATEALQALKEHGADSPEFRSEIADIFVFLATLLNHLSMSDEELEDLMRRKMMINFSKYRPEDFANKTVSEGIRQARENYEAR